MYIWNLSFNVNNSPPQPFKKKKNNKQITKRRTGWNWFWIRSRGGAGSEKKCHLCLYLVVRPDGDFELRQDSLHLQVPLCCVDRGLQDLVWFGGRFRFLSENRTTGYACQSSRRQKWTGNWIKIMFGFHDNEAVSTCAVTCLRNFRLKVIWENLTHISRWTHSVTGA